MPCRKHSFLQGTTGLGASRLDHPPPYPLFSQVTYGYLNYFWLLEWTGGAGEENPLSALQTVGFLSPPH